MAQTPERRTSKLEGANAIHGPILVKEVTNDEAAISQIGELMRTSSWTEAELEGFDWESELLSRETFKVGIFAGEKLVAFAAASPLFTPDVGMPESGRVSKYPIGEDLWIGYLVLGKEVRNDPRVTLSLPTVFEKLEQHSKTYTESHPHARILACTENPRMEKFFARRGWEFVEETEIVDKNGTVLGMTKVFEKKRVIPNV